MHNIKKIIITGDILRPDHNDPSQSESVCRIRWFEDLLMPPISQVSELPVSRLASDGNSLDFSSLFRDFTHIPSLDSWAYLFARELPNRLQERLVNICRDALVIGIEISPSVVKALSMAGIPVIDCSVYPLRFLYDIPLAWRSTESAIQRAFEEFRLSNFEVARRVAQIRAKCRWMPDPGIPEGGVTLVLDQVQSDSALINAKLGRFVGWGDYLDRLVELKALGPVIWRGHPSNTNHKHIAKILGERNQTKANFYHLLAQDGLVSVAAISSGGVEEARAFSKKGIHFMDRYAGIDLTGWSTPVPVLGHWLSPHFWSKVLAPIIDTTKGVQELVIEKDTFRRTINFDWQFGWIDQVSAVKPPNEEEILKEREQEYLQRLENLENRNEEFKKTIEHLEARNANLASQVGQLVPYALDSLYPRVKKLLQICETRQEKIGVWGAGGLARLMIERGAIDPAKIHLWIDSDSTRWGQSFMESVIFDPAWLMLNECDVILICTLLPPDEIFLRIKDMVISAKPIWIGDQFVITYEDF